MNKPSKKTEWNYNREVKIIGAMDLYGLDRETAEQLTEDVEVLLHKRDNEIREWAKRKLRGECGIIKLTGSCGHYHGDDDGYNACLDDLLTYLSNRKV